MYLLIIRNRHVDELNSIQYNRIDTQCAWRRRSLPFFFSSLSLFRSLVRSFSFSSTDGSTIEKRKNFFFWKKYKHWIRIISSFNSSTWFTVCYSKGVSVYCSLSLSRSSLITAVGSGIFKQTTAFVRFPFFWQNATKRKREREEFFSLFCSANTLPSDVTVISIGA